MHRNFHSRSTLRQRLWRSIETGLHDLHPPSRVGTVRPENKCGTKAAPGFYWFSPLSRAITLRVEAIVGLSFSAATGHFFNRTAIFPPPILCTILSNVLLSLEKFLHRGVLAVLDKCSNSKCSAVFRHLGDGKLFHAPRVEMKPGVSVVPGSTVAMEHFWLCSKCAEIMTLRINHDGKVEVISLPSARGSAA